MASILNLDHQAPTASGWPLEAWASDAEEVADGSQGLRAVVVVVRGF